MRRILWGVAILCAIAFSRSFLEWAFDHFAGQGKFAFNRSSLYYILPFIAIVTYLLVRRESVETHDSGAGQLKMFAVNALLASIAVFLLWNQQGFSNMFDESDEAAYPFPYRGTVLLMSTWMAIVVILQMIATVFVAFQDARGNVYDQDEPPL